MNKNQEKVFEMLKEFDELCKGNNIEYFLFGDTLLYATCCHGIMPETYFAVVVMTADNTKRFIDAAKSSGAENREIEYWGNSEKYPDYSIRYTDASTTAFNMLDWPDYKAHGFYIEIRPLRSTKPAKKHRKQLVLERGLLLDSHNVNTLKTTARSPGNIKRLAYYKAWCIKKPHGKLKRELFEYWLKNGKPYREHKGASGSYSYAVRPGKFVEISENHFREVAVCEIEGMEFPAPLYTRTLLTQIYPDRFFPGEQRDSADISNMYFEHSLTDTDMPYRDFFADKKPLMGEHKRARKCKHQYDLQNKDNRGNKAEAADNWATVCQTDARYRMAEHYAPLKEEIILADETGDDATLRKILKPYHDELQELSKNGKVFAFDKDILNIYLKLLEREGKYEQVDNILNNMPITHLRSVVDNMEGKDD